MARMNTKSSPGFDSFPTLFIRRAEIELMDGQGKAQRENVLLPLLTDLFKLLPGPEDTVWILPHKNTNQRIYIL